MAVASTRVPLGPLLSVPSELLGLLQSIGECVVVDPTLAPFGLVDVRDLQLEVQSSAMSFVGRRLWRERYGWFGGRSSLGEVCERADEEASERDI